MDVVLLGGTNLTYDREQISARLGEDVYYVLTGGQKLHQYIEALDLDGIIQAQVRICREVTGINADYIPANGKPISVDKMSDLLEHIDISVSSDVIIKGDLDNSAESSANARKRVSDIVQQLVFLQMPLTAVHIMTEREAHDIAKVRLFEKMLPIHKENVKESIASMEGFSPTMAVGVEHEREVVLASLRDIQFNLGQVHNTLNIVVAASKKTGKSVIVNSMIGYELAPTSLELATPNNCIYTKGARYKLTCKNEQTDDVMLEQTFDTPEEMRRFIERTFKEAQLNPEQKYGVPDMEIEYVQDHEGFSAYRIFDTPGPDLAGADAHKEAANKAIEEADVIIFAIDYAKHLTDTEMNYLTEVRDICAKKNKFYSLIIVVNRIDERYDSQEAKSVPRSLDYIREKLISIDQRFSNSIIMGTSALTYFDCLAAVRIPKCEMLGENDGRFEAHLRECIRHYIAKPEMTILNFLSKMTQNVYNFHGREISNIEDLMEESGMPSLLSYVAYIAQTKARTEKINNLMYQISEAYSRISLIYAFQELEEELAHNQDKLEAAREIFNVFQQKMDSIYDTKYRDVCRKIDNGVSKSEVLNEFRERSVFRFDGLQEVFNRRYVREYFNNDVLINALVSGPLRGSLRSKLDQLYEKNWGKKNIGGVKKKIVPEKEIMSCIKGSINAKTISDTGNSYISARISDVTEKLESENDCILSFMEDIVEERRTEMSKAVSELEMSLQENCGISLNITLPPFQFVFQRHGPRKSVSLGNMNVRKLNDNIRDAMEALYSNEQVPTAEDGIIKKIAYFFRSGDEINRICYDMKYVIDKVYDAELKEDVGAILRKCDFESFYRQDKDRIVKGIADFCVYLEKEMAARKKAGTDIAAQAKVALDHTEEYISNIDALQRRRTALEKFKKCTDIFCIKWRDEIMSA